MSSEYLHYIPGPARPPPVFLSGNGVSNDGYFAYKVRQDYYHGELSVAVDVFSWELIENFCSIFYSLYRRRTIPPLQQGDGDLPYLMVDSFGINTPLHEVYGWVNGRPFLSKEEFWEASLRSNKPSWRLTDVLPELDCCKES
jgi:hypothetical protein